MAAVETLGGPVAADDLGVTLMHEHVFVLTPELLHNYPEHWDEATRIQDAVEKLSAAQDRGIDTIVDPTVLGLGRDIPLVQRVAAQVTINIVVATGLYTYDRLPFAFRFRGPGTPFGGPEPLDQLFIRDLTEGIADTGVRAGILKCATDEEGVTPDVERVLRAVARAHLATGAPITTHTHAPSRRGIEQQRIFAEEGADLGRVVIGHSGDTTDLDYLEQLIDAGSYVGMDRFGVDVVPFEQRVDTVVQLCERGYADRVVLSHDAVCHADWFDMDLMAEVAPRWTFTHIPDDVLPALREHGVTETQIRSMLVENPRRILAGETA